MKADVVMRLTSLIALLIMVWAYALSSDAATVEVGGEEVALLEDWLVNVEIDGVSLQFDDSLFDDASVVEMIGGLDEKAVAGGGISGFPHSTFNVNRAVAGTGFVAGGQLSAPPDTPRLLKSRVDKGSSSNTQDKLFTLQYTQFSPPPSTPLIPIPEPATVSLLVTGLAGLVWRRGVAL